MNAKIASNQTGCVFYDGECSFCAGWAQLFERVLSKRGFALATLQSGTSIMPVARALQREQSAMGRQDARPTFTGMRLQLADGCELGGSTALVAIARRIWWAWPLFALAQIPGVMLLLHAAYRLLAAKRHCISGACSLTCKELNHHRHTAFFELP